MLISMLLALGSAFAQDPLAAGTVFTVKDIAAADGYFAQKADLVGKECTSTGQLTVTPGTSWYGGPARCGASTYYFYQIALDAKVAYGSATVANVPAGTPFVVRDIATDDAYYTTRAKVIGQACTAGTGMTRTDGAWWSGPAKCADQDYYFYKMSFDVTGDAPASGTFGSATLGALPVGSTFTIRDIHAEDAYAADRATLVGLSCTAGADMSRTDGEWWAGSATCNGNSFYFYKMAFDATQVAVGTYGSATAAANLYPPTKVVIRDISTDDLYGAQRDQIVGRTCTVAADLHRNEGQWYGGDVNCDNGTYYYFYKVAFDVVGDANTTPASSFGSATAPETLSPPTEFVIREIAPDDAYYSSASTMVGLTCAVSSDLHRNDGQWYGGGARCAGTDYYFYKVAFDLVGGAAAGGGFGSASAPDALQSGASLTIRDIAPDDAYVGDKARIVGQRCTVGSSGLSRTEGPWYGGDVNCADGSYYYFYKMAFDLGDGAMPETLSAGTVVSIVDIARDDAYFADRDSYVGLTCTVANDLHRNDGDWYGGDVNCGDSYLYFYKAKFSLGGGAAAATGSRYYGYSIPKKASVTVVDVSPDDAFYPYREALLGQTCTVKKTDLTTTGEGWFGGTLKCNGTKLYFYQVGVIY